MDTGAKKLLRPPAHPARLPFLAPWSGSWQPALWEALTEAVTSIAGTLVIASLSIHLALSPGGVVGSELSKVYCLWGNLLLHCQQT